jgi:hypothetical protein
MQESAVLGMINRTPRQRRRRPWRAAAAACLAAVVLLAAGGAVRPCAGAARAGCNAAVPGAQAGIEPACLAEVLGIAGSCWDLGLGLLLNGEPGTDCYRLSLTGDVLALLESMLAYSICAMRASDDPDADLLERRIVLRKLVMVAYEFLYIIDLLACYPDR